MAKLSARTQRLTVLHDSLADTLSLFLQDSADSNLPDLIAELQEHAHICNTIRALDKVSGIVGVDGNAQDFHKLLTTKILPAIEQRLPRRDVTGGPANLLDLVELLNALATWEARSESGFEMKAENLPVKFLRPKTGMMTFVCGFVMHKDTKDAGKAHALIDSNNSEAATAFLVTEMGYGPANTKAMKSIDPAVREKAELPEDVDAFLATGFFQQAIPEKDKLVAMWQEIRALSGR